MIEARIQSKHDTTENWNNTTGFIPLVGEIIIYDDYKQRTVTKVVDGEEVTQTVNVPGIKIGTGNGYVQDLMFVDDDVRQMILEHIRDQEAHVTAQEKSFWNNKVNVDDAYEQIHDELENETLILNRN